MNLPIHPAANLFPPMSAEELSLLADDIAANGLLEPIVIYQGQVLDGRNRLAACELADVGPRFQTVNGDIGSPTIYVLSKNLHRRHLTISQRAAIAAEVVPLLEGEAHKRQLAGTLAQTCTKGKSAEIAAKELQVGARSVQKAVAVKRDSPEAFERVRRGEMTVNEAAGEQEKQQERRRVQKENTPYVPKTDRQIEVAESHKKRMISALSTIGGLARGLNEELDLRMAVSVCSRDDITTWAEHAKESAKHLRMFVANLERNTNAERSQID